MSRETVVLAFLTAYFSLLAIVFYNYGGFIWPVLVGSALVWFVIEAKRAGWKKTKMSFFVGLFLLIFDFIVQNTGWVFGLWEVEGMFSIGVVPIEVMFIAFFGGSAWALYMPEKFWWRHSLVDSFVFSFFGTLGEFLLIKHGYFVYPSGWTSLHAFFAYFITWWIMNWVRYKVVFGKRRL